MYKIECDCTDDDHSHVIDIDADDHVISVTIYTTLTTNYWSWNGLMTRLRLTWDIWTKGYATHQGSIVLREQVALNYAETLKSAINDLREFRKGDAK